MDKKGWKKKYIFSELFFQKDGKNAALVFFLIKNAALVLLELGRRRTCDYSRATCLHRWNFRLPVGKTSPTTGADRRDEEHTATLTQILSPMAMSSHGRSKLSISAIIKNLKQFPNICVNYPPMLL